MCGKMCGKLDTCVKYVLNAIRANHLNNLIKINAKNMADDQNVSCVKKEVLGESLRLSGVELNTAPNGTQASPVTLPKNRLKIFPMSATSVTKRLKTGQTYIGLTTVVTTLLQTWFTLIRVAMQSMADILQLKTHVKGLAQHTEQHINNQPERRVVIFAV